MTGRIQTIPTPALWRMFDRAFDRVEHAMTHEVPASALIYGWDWPTAFVLWPRLVRRYEAIRDELRARYKSSGLTRREFVELHCCDKWQEEG